MMQNVHKRMDADAMQLPVLVIISKHYTDIMVTARALTTGVIKWSPRLSGALPKMTTSRSMSALFSYGPSKTLDGAHY